MKALIFCAALAVAAPAAAQAATLKLAVQAPAAGPCKALGPEGSANDRAYRDLLSKRLGVEVLDCPVTDANAAAQALAAGQVDLALLDPAAYGPVSAKVRAILTVRAKGGLSRVPVVLAALANSSRQAPKDFKGGKVAFGGEVPSALGLPRLALADQGMGPGFFSQEEVAKTDDEAAARVRDGRADALALNAEAWQRICRANTPKEKPCADLKIVWQGRPRATAALAVRRDMPDQLRYRLIGIYIAMHLEAPQAFAAASAFAPGGEDFEPSEADALSPAKVVP